MTYGFVQTVQILRGHLDFSFASAWNPDGYTIATGNQDKTCRVWDVRNPSKSLAVLRGNLGAIRSIRFTSDGQFMAMAEPADFVHIFDVRSGYNERQELDFFGEISGISFSPDAEALFVGVWDRSYGNGNFRHSKSLRDLNKSHRTAPIRPPRVGFSLATITHPSSITHGRHPSDGRGGGGGINCCGIPPPSSITVITAISESLLLASPPPCGSHNLATVSSSGFLLCSLPPFWTQE
ncbi:hypothetical protein B296_00013125 [Ensete ventricosum]|uniref:DUF2415 domain-containing protein n=1 Tax=Ensete ventricosum TaxID=4639 RepID=A0A426ZMX2_ENSVE|nr:hypothetical protein B296_00013125 [Ensete ventricosum]